MVNAVDAGRIHLTCDAANEGEGKNGPCKEGGNSLQIVHANGTTSTYRHLTRHMLVSEGQEVEAGQLVGFTGNTGNVVECGCEKHLHVEKRTKSNSAHPGGVLVDPADYIQ